METGHRSFASTSSSQASFCIRSTSSGKQQARTETVAVELEEASSARRQSPDESDRQHVEAEPQTSSVSPRGLIAHKRKPFHIAALFMPRWLLTATFAASMYGVLKHYAAREVMSEHAKRGFNAVITGLSIALGLILVASLNGMVGDLRWWILSQRFRSRRKVESILRASSMTQLVHLSIKTRRPKIYIGVIVWLLVVLGSQIAVASISLCYSTGAAEVYALKVKGDINIADMSSIQTDKVVTTKSRALGAEQYTANSYGTVSTTYTIVEGKKNAPAPGTIFYPGDPFIFWDKPSYIYIFREISIASMAKDGIWATAVTTSRSVEATARCNSWRVMEGGDGRETIITVLGDQGPFNVTLPLAGGTDQTTYMTNTTKSCGYGCSEVTAFESAEDDAWYYRCNVTVGSIANATLPQHQISEDVCVLASSGIALQGYGVSTLAKSSDVQYQSYPLETIFGSTANGSTIDMANLLARFTIGVVATTGEWNWPYIIKDTIAPQQGVQLTLEHQGMIILILAGLVLGQLVLEVIIAVWANRVVVPPRGDVAMAHVLRAMTIDQTHPEPASHFDLSRVSSKVRTSDSQWIYRVSPVSGKDVFDLGMEKAPR